MKKQVKLAWVAAVAVAWAWLGLAADSPQVIPFQGRLTDQSGTPYNEGTYTIVFSLYDAPVGGTALWTERHTGVGLVNGMVNVFLGSIAPFDGQDFTQTRYLGITIDADGNANTADPEMVPRQMIVPAFFAKNSEKLMGADWSAILAKGETDPRNGYINGARIASKSVKAAQIADKNVTTAKLADKSVTAEKIADGAIEMNHLSAAMKNDLASAFLPAGIIMPFAGPVANVPDGWLPCDGKTLKSTDYPKLFANIGTTWGYETNIIEEGVTYFKLPDFSNRTLWGAGEHAVGEKLEAGLPQHAHYVLANRYSTESGIGGNTAVNAGSSGSLGNHDYTLKGTTSMRANVGLSSDAINNGIYGAADTVQPPSGVVNFIIKVDPTY